MHTTIYVLIVTVLSLASIRSLLILHNFIFSCQFSTPSKDNCISPVLETQIIVHTYEWSPTGPNIWNNFCLIIKLDISTEVVLIKHLNMNVLVNTGSVIANWVFWISSDRKNMQVRFCLKVILKSWDLRNFAITASFHEMHTLRHLRSKFANISCYFLGNFKLLWILRVIFKQ